MKLRRHISRSGQRSSAFTLLEVIIACAIFFVVAFAVLEVVTVGLVAAKKLQQREPDFDMLVNPHALTNQLVEGSESGDFEDLYPGLYPGYSWAYDIQEAFSNGFFRVDYYLISGRGKGASEQRLTVFFSKPGSPPGSASQGRY
ncbi:MAG: prepilin-type N-terminal cleavage/methylation domain-containing protein [Verrucomicrobia subdivision 3 bacterium]|nr:prepilin-type N-terminal cleavage/methylation domain-containing protein [Limisphaerales bacterium]